jgi:hypothetical protein
MTDTSDEDRGQSTETERPIRAATLGGGELVLIFGLAVAYVFFYLWFKSNAPFWFPADEDTDGLARAGQFGDMFGAVNAFVSGVAMLAVLGTLLLQRRQNILQAHSLEEARVQIVNQQRATERELRLSGKDYIERNKPVVFCDRVEHPADENNFHYVMRNVGGGFAVNVYFLDGDHDGPPIPLGSLSSGEARRLPARVNMGTVRGAGGTVFILVAEGPVSRTTQWTPTLNYRTSDISVHDGGQVLHRVAQVENPPTRGVHQPLSVFLENNKVGLLRQLTEFGVLPGALTESQSESPGAESE